MFVNEISSSNFLHSLGDSIDSVLSPDSESEWDSTTIMPPPLHPTGPEPHEYFETIVIITVYKPVE